MQKSVIQWSVISKLTCSRREIMALTTDGHHPMGFYSDSENSHLDTRRTDIIYCSYNWLTPSPLSFILMVLDTCLCTRVSLKRETLWLLQQMDTTPRFHYYDLESQLSPTTSVLDMCLFTCVSLKRETLWLLQQMDTTPCFHSYDLESQLATTTVVIAYKEMSLCFYNRWVPTPLGFIVIAGSSAGWQVLKYLLGEIYCSYDRWVPSPLGFIVIIGDPQLGTTFRRLY